MRKNDRCAVNRSLYVRAFYSADRVSSKYGLSFKVFLFDQLLLQQSLLMDLNG